MATVSIDTGVATILAEASFDLNTLSLASDWIVRAGGDGVTEDTQPHVGMLFSGPIIDPQQQTDLAPLLDLLRSHYMQRQLDELEALEQERQGVAAGRAAREASEAQGVTRPAVSPTAATSPPAEAPVNAPAAGAPAGPDPPASTASIDPAPPADAVSSDESTPREARDAELRQALERIAPAIRDVMSGSAAEAAPPPQPAARQPASRRQAAPAARQPAPARARAQPVRANPQRARPSPPADGETPATGASAPAEPAQAESPEEGTYSTLPNGVILKVR
jgi:hypothetical protein